MSFKLNLGDFVEEFGVPGIAIGVGAIILAPIVGPALAKTGKPVAKALVKGSILVYEKSKGALAEARESLEDIVAESKAELAEAESQKLLMVGVSSSEPVYDKSVSENSL